MERLTFDNNVRYVGKLATISSSNPSDMIVRFQLSKFYFQILTGLQETSLYEKMNKMIKYQ